MGAITAGPATRPVSGAPAKTSRAEVEVVGPLLVPMGVVMAFPDALGPKGPTRKASMGAPIAEPREAIGTLVVPRRPARRARSDGPPAPWIIEVKATIEEGVTAIRRAKPRRLAGANPPRAARVGP